MFDTDKVYFLSISAFEFTLYTLFEIRTNERLFRAHVVTKISCLLVEKIFIYGVFHCVSNVRR